jgi:DtxR family Mn-dependent transcriptional regulator
MKDLTFTMENYLEAIYELSLEGNGARVSDIAERLGVTKASTNSAMATLANRGLVQKEKYREVYLTPKGKELAMATSQKHHVIQRFLVHILGVEPGVADEDACAIEHVISRESVIAMQKHMDSGADCE